MNHRHRKTLHALFAHPVSGNIDFKHVEHLLVDLGAKIEHRSGARLAIKLNDQTIVVHHAQHSMPTEEVAQIRKFLEACNVDPNDYPV